MNGYVKMALEEAGHSVGVSLPLVTRGFDDLFESIDTGTAANHIWKMSCMGLDVFCEIHVEFILPEAQETLASIRE